MVDGEKDAKARLVAKGYQGPDLRDGSVDASGRASIRSSRFRISTLGTPKKWSM